MLKSSKIVSSASPCSKKKIEQNHQFYRRMGKEGITATRNFWAGAAKNFEKIRRTSGKKRDKKQSGKRTNEDRETHPKSTAADANKRLMQLLGNP